jgi:hypothetical protein
MNQACDTLLANTDPTFAASITCNSTGYVTQIQLGANTPGRFPIDILSTMTALTTLQLIGEGSGAAPASLSSLGLLTRLNTLILFQHNFTGLSIPPSITSLTALTSLALNLNGLVGSVPTNLFSSLNRLRAIDLADNSLVGTVPSATALVAVGYLALNGNRFSGALSLPTYSIGSQNDGCTLVGHASIPNYFYGETNCWSSCTGGCCAKFAKLCPNGPATTTTTRIQATTARPTSAATMRPTTIATTTMRMSMSTLSTTTTTTEDLQPTGATPSAIVAHMSSIQTTARDVAFESSSSHESITDVVVAFGQVDVVIGASVGGLYVLSLLVLTLVVCIIRRRRRRKSTSGGALTPLGGTATAADIAGANSHRDMYSTRNDNAQSNYGYGTLEGSDPSALPATPGAQAPFVGVYGQIRSANGTTYSDLTTWPAQ